MSIRIMAMVWDAYPSGGSDLLALLALADWSDDEGRCWPSMSSIATKTRLSRSQAQRVVHGLISAGFLEVIGNEEGGKPGATRQYQIKLRALTGRTHATGSAGATGSTDAQDGSHPCGETGRTHATRTISEPSRTVSEPMSLDIGGVQAKPEQRIPDCPHQEIIGLYARHLPMLPQPRIWNGQRAASLKARWRWVLTAKRPNGERYATDSTSALDFFDRLFCYVAESDFLTGRNGQWLRCDLPWLVKDENFAKALEGKYENRHEVAT